MCKNYSEIVNWHTLYGSNVKKGNNMTSLARIGKKGRKTKLKWQ